MTPPILRRLRAALASAVLVAGVTGAIALLEPRVPALGLGVLYLLAVVPVALVYGAAAAGAVSLVSMAAFSYFFLPPRYTLNPGTPDRWSGLAAFLVSSLVVSHMAARSQREALRSTRLAEEQAALRRVATQVARGVPPTEVFAAVAREVGLLLGVDATHMARYEPDGTATEVAAWSRAEGQTRGRLSGGSAVGAPIEVDQRPWGVMLASSTDDRRLPVDAESRIAAFTELLATAIANAESRAGLARLAEEQAALRRVATLVARGAPAEDLFGAVTEEVGRLLRVGIAGMSRYEPDGTVTVVAVSGREADSVRPFVGRRWRLGGNNISTLVWDTGRPARLDRYVDPSGPLGDAAREHGVGAAVGAPIVVDGNLWGAMGAYSTAGEPLPADTESRLETFTELVATAISNTEARREVAASRARIVAATDEERRRVVRDLHDGAQQRLVHTIITLKLARRALQNEQAAAPALLGEALEHSEQAMVELRELAHGILPAALTQGGLRAGVAVLASRMPVPVEIDVSVSRLPTAVEATAYFVVAEALTNVAKHARAAHAEVMARIVDGTLAVHVRDDGIGGAQPAGSGLVGLADRLAAIDGELRIESPGHRGTLIAAAIPLSG
ncbi:MAG: hypothetical protein QOH62_1415 [Solirubrobacteraceae bacterium]|nr:hypothetical protein [Solirubrobacteraceae bacterium]